MDPNASNFALDPRYPFIRTEHPVPGLRFIKLAGPMMKGGGVSCTKPLLDPISFQLCESGMNRVGLALDLLDVSAGFCCKCETDGSLVLSDLV